MADKEVKTPVEEKVDAPAADAEAPVTEVTDGAPAPKPKKKKVKRNVTHARINVLSTFNNTIITVADDKGNVITSSSAGASGFRGSKKGTAYAAQVAAEKAISDAKQGFGVTNAEVFVKGVGMGRDAAVRTLINQRIAVESVRDVTGIAHGGVRPRKAKRN